jgi:hypothetical protein
LTDEKLEPAVDAFRRAVAQARMRAVREGSEDDVAFANDLLVSPSEMRRILRTNFHGEAWAGIQALSPVLHRRRVTFAGVARETRIALELRDKLLLDNRLWQTHLQTSAMSHA